MVFEAADYLDNDVVNYANGLVQVMKQHRIILPEEEDEFRKYLGYD